MPFRVIRVDPDVADDSPRLISEQMDDDDDDDARESLLQSSVPFRPHRSFSPTLGVPFPHRELRRALLLFFASVVFALFALSVPQGLAVVLLVAAVLLFLPSVYVLIVILLTYMGVEGFSYDDIPGVDLF